MLYKSKRLSPLCYCFMAIIKVREPSSYVIQTIDIAGRSTDLDSLSLSREHEKSQILSFLNTLASRVTNGSNQ